MATLRETLEAIMPNQPRMLKLFPEGPSMDNRRPKHVRFTIKKGKSDEQIDMDEVTVTLRSDEFIDEVIHIQTIIDSFQQLEGELVRKVIYMGHEITNSHLALYNQAEINFIIAHDLEKA